MVVCVAVGLFVGTVIVSAIVTIFLGIDEAAMQYDWRKEQWIFVPERHDLLLEMIIKKK